MKKIFLSTIILVLPLQILAFTYINGVECILNDGLQKSSMSGKLINGTVHFLKSKSYADLLLYEYEKSALQEFNYFASLEFVEKAVVELESAKFGFNEAIGIGKRIGYNEKKIPLFSEFNYDEFISYKNLNKEIAQKVKNYLVNGDIIGIYRHCAGDMDDILDTLYIIRENVKSGQTPEIDIIWKLLQQYSESILFGNYATVMGTTILGQYNDL